MPPTSRALRRPRTRPRTGKDLTLVTLVVIVSALLFVLIGLPLLRILIVAFSPEGWRIVTSMITDPVNRGILWNTVKLGTIVALIGAAIGFVMAYAQVRLKFRGKKFLHLISLLPIVSPPFALATAVITLFGRNGVISNGIFGLDIDIYGLKGLTIVLSLSFFRSPT